MNDNQNIISMNNASNNNGEPNPVNNYTLGAVNNPEPQNTSNNDPSLNSLNIDGTYNKMQKPDYADDQQIKANMEQQKNKTITVTKELKTVIIISLILLLVIIFMPNLFDIINNIIYR